MEEITPEAGSEAGNEPISTGEDLPPAGQDRPQGGAEPLTAPVPIPPSAAGAPGPVAGPPTTGRAPTGPVAPPAASPMAGPGASPAGPGGPAAGYGYDPYHPYGPIDPRLLYGPAGGSAVIPPSGAPPAAGLPYPPAYAAVQPPSGPGWGGYGGGQSAGGDPPTFGSWPAAEPAGPPPGGGPTRSRNRTIAIVAAAAVVVAIGAFFGVRALTGTSSNVSAAGGPTPTASPTGRFRPRNGLGRFPGGTTAGTISGINGSTLTITTPAGSSVTVDTSPSTTIEKTVTASASAIAQGDTVIAIGSSSGNGIAATRITDSGSAAGTTPPLGTRRFPGGFGGAGFGVAAGKVTAISGSTLTVTEPDGTAVTVTTSPSTTVTTTQKIALSDLSTGQTVRVAGTTNSDGSVTASTIVEGAAGGRFGGFFPTPAG
jgi:hypothetical protein